MSSATLGSIGFLRDLCLTDYKFINRIKRLLFRARLCLGCSGFSLRPPVASPSTWRRLPSDPSGPEHRSLHCEKYFPSQISYKSIFWMVTFLPLLKHCIDPNSTSALLKPAKCLLKRWAEILSLRQSPCRRRFSSAGQPTVARCSAGSQLHQDWSVVALCSVTHYRHSL